MKEKETKILKYQHIHTYRDLPSFLLTTCSNILFPISSNFSFHFSLVLPPFSLSATPPSPSRAAAGGGRRGRGVVMAIDCPRQRLTLSFFALLSGSLAYYHCSFGNYSLISLGADLLIVFLCSIFIVGLLFRHANISLPVDPLDWRVSQDATNRVAECIANIVGAAESVLRVAARGEDKKLFVKVAASLYILSAFGRATSGATAAYLSLCFASLIFCMCKLARDSYEPSAYNKRN